MKCTLRRFIADRSLAVCDIDDFQPLFLGIADRIGGAAGGFGQVADAHAAAIHQVAIAPEHTFARIYLRNINNFVRLFPDARVDCFVRGVPELCLGETRQDQNQSDVRILRFQCQHELRRHGIKAQSASCAEKAVTLFDQTGDDIFQALVQNLALSRGNASMSCKTCCPLSHFFLQRLFVLYYMAYC